MSRHDVTDAEWNAMRVFFPKARSGKRGRPWADHRKTLNGILWLIYVGSPWRDIPTEYGKWQTIYGRFRRWCREGVWDRIWNNLLKRIDRDGVLDRNLWCVDGTIVRAHVSAVGGSSKTSRNAGQNALGRSRGGFATKLHVACDGNGIPLAVLPTAGNINEPTQFIKLMEEIPLSLHRKQKRPNAVAGDKAYVAGYIFKWIDDRGIENVIPNRKNENKNPKFCKRKYKQRNVVERLIGKLKLHRRIATRYDKTVESYLAIIKIACLRITLNTI